MVRLRDQAPRARRPGAAASKRAAVRGASRRAVRYREVAAPEAVALRGVVRVVVHVVDLAVEVHLEAVAVPDGDKSLLKK